jgi:hypothetical protein
MAAMTSASSWGVEPPSALVDRDAQAGALEEHVLHPEAQASVLRVLALGQLELDVLAPEGPVERLQDGHRSRLGTAVDRGKAGGVHHHAEPLSTAVPLTP